MGGKERHVALIPISPVSVSVRCDLFDGRPRSIRMGTERVPVKHVARVRQESAAYPQAVGPRTLFEVDTPDTRLELAFHHRSRRWSVQAMDPEAHPA